MDVEVPVEIFLITRANNHLHIIKEGFSAASTETWLDIYQSRDPNTLLPVPTQTYAAAFTLDSSDFPITVYGLRQYRLSATSPDSPDFTISSATFAITGDQQGLALNFRATNFSFPDWVQSPALVPKSPFSASGQWRWRLEDVALNGNAVSSTLLNLDFYFFLCDQANFDAPRHQLELIRLTVPPYQTIAERSWNEVEKAVVQNLATHLWGLGGPRRYDVDQARARHLMRRNNMMGIDLAGFMTVTRDICNCFDLAYFVNLCCRSLGRYTDAGQLVEVGVQNNHRSVLPNDPSLQCIFAGHFIAHHC
ncbi:unnamed protein product [Clonostachys rosea]|uniref:Uncharacterized protein n=1 Tax=Bionectria ochroleuca TaxID=29856 RepID=A0ABY6U5Y1_BIOOC|nr:unnamed protein product [Clonostachys rosea]